MHQRNDEINALAKVQSYKKLCSGRKACRPSTKGEGLNFLANEPLFDAARLGIRPGFHFELKRRKGEIFSRQQNAPSAREMVPGTRETSQGREG